MPTLEGLRRQTDTATDLRSVVTTMKTLAAVSIHQYERASAALAEYSRTIDLGLQIALRDKPFPQEPQQAAGGAAAVVFGSDQGMCGQFNEQIVTFFDSHAKANGSACSWRLLAVGVRAEGQLRDAGFELAHTYETPASVTEITNLLQEMLPDVERLRRNAEISRLLIFHNRRTSASSSAPLQLQLLPVDEDRLARWRHVRWKSRSLPTFVTGRRQLLSQLVRHHLFVSLFRACAESLASENANRIAAMQAAEKNIEERLDELRGAYNNLRQSAVTEELLDIVTGFEALSRQSHA